MDAFKGLEDLLQLTTAKMGRDGTAVSLKWLKQGFFDPTFSYTLSFNVVSQAQRILGAPKEGFDAVVIGNALDFGLREARSVVDIPVAGVTEGALYLASSLGKNYSFVVVHNQTGQFLADLIKQYGMTDRLASIADMGVPLAEVAAVYQNTDRLINLFAETARRTIQNDHAEVVVAGCTILSSLLTMKNIHDVDGVPIVDPVWAGIKMAEILVDLKRAYGIGASRSTVYKACPDWDKEIPPIMA